MSQVIGDTEKIENCKKQIDVWSTILEKHAAQLEEEKKKKR